MFWNCLSRWKCKKMLKQEVSPKFGTWSFQKNHNELPRVAQLAKNAQSGHPDPFMLSKKSTHSLWRSGCQDDVDNFLQKIAKFLIHLLKRFLLLRLQLSFCLFFTISLPTNSNKKRIAIFFFSLSVLHLKVCLSCVRTVY